MTSLEIQLGWLNPNNILNADFGVNDSVLSVKQMHTAMTTMTVRATIEVVKIAFDNPTFGVLRKLVVVAATFVLKRIHDRITFARRQL